MHGYVTVQGVRALFSHSRARPLRTVEQLLCLKDDQGLNKGEPPNLSKR